MLVKQGSMLFLQSQQVWLDTCIYAKTSVLPSQGVGLELRIGFIIRRRDWGNRGKDGAEPL